MKEKRERVAFGTRKTLEDGDVGLSVGQCGLGEHSVKVGRANPGETAGPKVIHLQDALDRGPKPQLSNSPKVRVQRIWEDAKLCCPGRPVVFSPGTNQQWVS